MISKMNEWKHSAMAKRVLIHYLALWPWQESRSRSSQRSRIARPAWWCQRQPFTRPRPSMPKGRWRRSSSWWPTCGESHCPPARQRLGAARCWRSRPCHPPSWTAASSEWSTPSWWGWSHSDLAFRSLFGRACSHVGIDIAIITPRHYRHLVDISL